MEKKSINLVSYFTFFESFRFSKKKEVTEAVRFINEIVEVIPERIKEFHSIYSPYNFNRSDLNNAKLEYSRVCSNRCENEEIYIRLRNEIYSMEDTHDKYTNILINISIDIKNLFKCLNIEMRNLCDILTQSNVCSIAHDYSIKIGFKIVFLSFIEYLKYEKCYSFSTFKEYFFSNDYPIYKIFISLDNGKKMIDSYFDEEQYFSLTALI